MRTITWLLITCLIILAAGCSSENRSWKKAEQKDSIKGYQEFLAKYPEGEFSEAAYQRLEAFYNERHPSIRNAKKVRIVVEESYGEAEDIRLPFRSVAERLFEHTGLKTVPKEAEDYDITLNVRVKAKPLKHRYRSLQPDRKGKYIYKDLYDTASITGAILLKIPGSLDYVKHFHAKAGPVSSDTSMESPSSAPFQLAFLESSFVRELVYIIRNYFGFRVLIYMLNDQHWDIRRHAARAFKGAEKPPIKLLMESIRKENSYAVMALGEIGGPAVEPLTELAGDKEIEIRRLAVRALGLAGDIRALRALIPALEDINPDVRWNAAEALGDIGDTRAVQALITALQDEHNLVRLKAAEALEKITGMNSNYDSSQWQKWWEENKNRPISEREFPTPQK